MFPYTNAAECDPRGLWFNEKACRDFGVSSIFFESLIENARNYVFPETILKYVFYNLEEIASPDGSLIKVPTANGKKPQIIILIFFKWYLYIKIIIEIRYSKNFFSSSVLGLHR